MEQSLLKRRLAKVLPASSAVALLRWLTLASIIFWCVGVYVSQVTKSTGFQEAGAL